MDQQKNSRVLIIAADPLETKMAERVLEEIDYTVAGKAANGQLAIEMTPSIQTDVILLDLDTSDLSAVDAILAHCPVPVVCFSAQETPELLQNAAASGVGAHVVKPLKAGDVERAIQIAKARFDDIMSLRRKSAELEALHEAGLRLTSSLELQPVLDALLEQVIKLVRADDAHIFFYDGEKLTFGAALWADGTQGQPIASPRPEGLTHAVARSGECIVISNVNEHPLFQEWPWGGGIVGIPLSFGDRVIGVMNVAFFTPHTFDENELRLLELVAAQAAIAIHNAHLFEQVQRHAAELEQRVAARTRELTEANTRLQELDRLKSKFIGDISHELRTPATNVRLYLQLLERGKPEKRDQYLSVIQEQTERMVGLVEDILNFSLLELNRSKFQFSAVDLNLIAEEVVAVHLLRAEAAGLTLVFEPDLSLPPVRAQPEQLTQVINNLVDNAINYSSAGRVRVVTRHIQELAQACLEVSDTGRGIDPKDLPHLFERFYRGHGVGSSSIAGAGLGLALTKEIVNLHGGRIEVDSQVGQGSTFKVFLPLEQSEA